MPRCDFGIDVGPRCPREADFTFSALFRSIDGFALAHGSFCSLHIDDIASAYRGAGYEVTVLPC